MAGSSASAKEREPMVRAWQIRFESGSTLTVYAPSLGDAAALIRADSTSGGPCAVPPDAAIVEILIDPPLPVGEA